MIQILMFAMTFAVALSAKASTIAVIDSGVDYKHKDLTSQYLLNSKETADNKVDDDANGYIDDVHGWSFADNTNQVIDYKYLGMFGAEIYFFFEVQARLLDGTATDADKEWMKLKRKDEAYIKRLQLFGNFAHGSHVAGISAKDIPEAKVFGVKLIPTEPKLPGQKLIEESPIFGNVTIPTNVKEMLLTQALKQVAGLQAKTLGVIGTYVANREAQVANCSFGTGYPQARTIVQTLYNAAFKEHERAEYKLEDFTIGFLKEMNTAMSVMVKNAPNTLFVFAAGNDGMNNDEKPAAPASIKELNAITVAATLRNKKIAVFSNYGSRMVDVAAPGVGILSTVPGDDLSMMSGTSQAAPYVTNVAAQILNLNPSLNPSQVREILMGTVDRKEWLKDKVVTEGFVNAKRSYEAALLAKDMEVRLAIAESRSRVPDTMEAISEADLSAFEATAEEAFVLPLQSTIQ